MSRLFTKYAISLAWIENSLLRHTLQQIDTNVPITIKGAIQTSAANKTVTIRVPVMVSVPIKGFYNFLIWSGGIIWAGAILFALFLLIHKLLIPHIFG